MTTLRFERVPGAEPEQGRGLHIIGVESLGWMAPYTDAGDEESRALEEAGTVLLCVHGVVFNMLDEGRQEEITVNLAIQPDTLMQLVIEGAGLLQHRGRARVEFVEPPEQAS